MNFERHGRRVVVTGMGVVAPNGRDLTTFWRTVRDGVSAAGPVTRFDSSALPSKIAAEVRDFDCSGYIDLKRAKRFDRSIQYALVAAVQAVRDARVDVGQLDPDRVGVVEATSLSGMESAFRGQTDYETKGYRRLSPFYLINAYSGSGSGEISVELGIKGHAITYSSGSASGNDAVGYAFNMIRSDEADVMVVGGAEAPLLPPLYAGFCVGRLLSCRNDDPPGAMRPFDQARDGLLLGEGAAFLVLEEMSFALGRGARVYAEILGHARSCEAYHSVAPHPDGVGIRRAMEKALRDARLHCSEVDYINAHGTATETNDTVETLAVKRLFGEHARRVAISSTKPVTGHLLAAAGALETVICVLAIAHQEIPPTINLTAPAAGCDLDYVPQKSRPYPVRVAMNLNSGFGGKNSSLILREFASAV